MKSTHETCVTIGTSGLVVFCRTQESKSNTTTQKLAHILSEGSFAWDTRTRLLRQDNLMSRDTFTFSNLVVARKIDDSLISASQASQRSHAGQRPNTPNHPERIDAGKNNRRRAISKRCSHQHFPFGKSLNSDLSNFLLNVGHAAMWY